MENIISSWVRWIKKKVYSGKKAISKFAGRVINLVPEPTRRTVNTLTENLMTKFNEIFGDIKKLPRECGRGILCPTRSNYKQNRNKIHPE